MENYIDEFGNIWKNLGCGCIECLEVIKSLFIPDTGKLLCKGMILTIDQLQTAINYANKSD